MFTITANFLKMNLSSDLWLWFSFFATKALKQRYRAEILIYCTSETAFQVSRNGWTDAYLFV